MELVCPLNIQRPEQWTYQRPTDPGAKVTAIAVVNYLAAGLTLLLAGAAFLL